ncbi:MAG: hypothetical protein ACRC8S_05110 [Fimbriiglobus sp.]
MEHEPISESEVQRLRFYRRVFSWMCPLSFVPFVVLAFGWQSFWGFCVAAVFNGVGLFFLRQRGTACPRCGRSLFLAKDVIDDENSSTDYLPLPDKCKSCGVRLLGVPEE